MENGEENSGFTKKEASTPAIDSSRMRLPPFWSNNPSVWFAQAEAQFSIFSLTADATKFSHIVSALPTDVCESVMELIVNPPKTDKYVKLKAALTNRHALSTELRLEKLLERAELGDRKPSEVFYSMKTLAGEAFDDKLVRTLWLRKLPQVIYVALTAMGDKHIDDLLPVADKIYEITTPSVATVSSATPSSSRDADLAGTVATIQHLGERLASVESMLSQLSTDRSRSPFSGYRPRSPHRRPRSGSRHRFNGKGFCFYHHKFGKFARKCEKPCNWVSKKPDSTKPDQKN